MTPPLTRSSPHKGKLLMASSYLGKRASPKKTTTVRDEPQRSKITDMHSKRQRKPSKKARVEVEDIESMNVEKSLDDHVGNGVNLVDDVDEQVGNEVNQVDDGDNQTRSPPRKSRLSKASSSLVKLASPKKKTVPDEPQRMKITNRRSKRQRKPSMKARVVIVEEVGNGVNQVNDVDEQVGNGVNEVVDGAAVSEDAQNQKLGMTIKMQIKRGPTQFRRQRHKEAPEIEFNSKGQPVGDYSEEMTSELGVLVRSTISLHHDDWRYVPIYLKEDVFTVLKQKYKIDEDNKDFFFGKMGCMLRQARCNKAKEIAEKTKEIEDEDERITVLASLKPVCMTDLEWEKYVTHVTSPVYKATGAYMSELRQNHTEPHGISRRGYARLEYDLKRERKTSEDIPREELWVEARKKMKPGEGKTKNTNSIVVQKLAREMQTQNNGQSSSTTLYKDPLAKARGVDPPGRVTGLGFGVTRTKLKVQVQSNKVVNSLVAQVNLLQSQVKTLFEEKNRGNCRSTSNDQPQVATPQSNHGSNAQSVFGVLKPVEGQPCKLLSWQGEIVAEGKVAFVGADRTVHGQRLGNDACSVWVDNPLIPEAPLFQQSSEFKTIGDAHGSTVAWHMSFISFDG